MLKRWIYALATTLLLTGCGGPDNTPEGIAEAFLQAAYDNDVDTLFEYIDVPEGTGDEEVALVRGKLSAQLARTEKYTESQGGLDRIEVQAPTLSDNDSQARIEAIVHFNNSDAKPKTERLRLNKVDGDWKIKI